jgi:MFS family permease
LASALSILLLKASADLRVWFPLRWIMGAASGIIVAIGEAWINELADDRKRGRIVASYTTTFTVCQLLGPLVIAMLGAASHWPILISTLLHGVVALFFLFLIKPEAVQVADEEGAQPLSIARFILHAPALCCGVLFFSFFDGTILSLFPVFGMHYGYSAAVAALMVSVILGGDAVLQLPLGWLADHMNRQRLHQYCGWLTLGLALALPWLMDKLWMLYPALVILGAAAGGIYTLALIQIGQIYRGNDLVTANAAAGMLWGVGSLIGPVFGGAALTLGRNGLPFTIAIAVLLFIAMSYAKPLSLSKVAPGE